MSNSYFQFKQFTIHHDRCAMKVGTDGVLLGAWAPTDGVKQILDVGTGTGLIAIQLSQRCPDARVTAVEIDKEAALQAKENVSASPWAERICIYCQDFCCFPEEQKFDLIVSNPPYFIDALKSPDRQRQLARHTGELNYELLFGKSVRLLSPQGRISIIVPSEVEKNVTDTAWKYGFFPCRMLKVYTKAGKPCRRILLDFAFQTPTQRECEVDELYIEDTSGQYSPEYKMLTGAFYLHF